MLFSRRPLSKSPEPKPARHPQQPQDVDEDEAGEVHKEARQLVVHE